MITIDQLLESVDLDFEPRWVTKNEDGVIRIWKHTPFIAPSFGHWNGDCSNTGKKFGRIKLSEFDGKDWTECIYEVPRKTTGKIEKLLEQKLTIGKTKYEYPTHAMLMGKINELVDMVNNIISVQEKMIDSRFVVDAVNELKGAKNE